MRVNKAHKTISLSVKISLVVLSFWFFFSYCIVPSLTSYLLTIWWVFTIPFPHESKPNCVFTVFFFSLLSSWFDPIVLSLRTKWRLKHSQNFCANKWKCFAVAVAWTKVKLIRNIENYRIKKKQNHRLWDCDTNTDGQLKKKKKVEVNYWQIICRKQKFDARTDHEMQKNTQCDYDRTKEQLSVTT